jgi:hypothetical protein
LSEKTGEEFDLIELLDGLASLFPVLRVNMINTVLVRFRLNYLIINLIILQLVSRIIFWGVMRALPARDTARHIMRRSDNSPNNLTPAWQIFDESPQSESSKNFRVNMNS